jgi:hypothetical protein
LLQKFVLLYQFLENQVKRELADKIAQPARKSHEAQYLICLVKC